MLKTCFIPLTQRKNNDSAVFLFVLGFKENMNVK